MTITICAILSLAFGWYILKPFYQTNELLEESQRVEDVAVLKEQKDRQINMLRDLDLDYTTGKIADDDYDRMKTDISRDLSDVITKIES